MEFIAHRENCAGNPDSDEQRRHSGAKIVRREARAREERPESHTPER